MASNSSSVGSRKVERFFLFLLSVVMVVLFYQLFTVLTADFADVPKRLANGTMINLNSSKPGERIKILLQKGFYLRDKRDINFIGDVVENGSRNVPGVIDNIGELNKSNFNVNTETAYLQGGEVFRKRVQVERSLLGFSDEDSILFQQERRKPVQLPSTNNLAMGAGSVVGVVQNGEEMPVQGVLVRLQVILPQDSLYSENVGDVEQRIAVNAKGVRRVFVVDSLNNRQLQSLTAFARTDAAGAFTFTGLPANRSFAVLPLQPGFEFGRSQGVENLEGSETFTFIQSPNTIKLFSNRDFSNLKKEKSLIVRTPREATTWFWIIVASFIVSFWLLHLLLTFRFPQADQLILPVIMVLTGLSFVTLFSLQDPLRDRFLSKSTLFYFGGGILGIIVLMLFNLRYFTTDSLIYRLFFFKGNRKAANGWPWAVVAMGLLLLTIVFGTGPEGSGVKVNLFGFQPSEIVKYLVIIFLAGFFAANEKFISEYTSLNKRFYFFFFALFAILTTIFLFLILGDLGPAMVCCFTFIILFSFSRGDFADMVGAVVLYVLALWICKNVWIGTAIIAAILTLYTLFKRKQLSESAVMALVVIAGFLLLDQIPYLDRLIPGPVQRLTDRKAIWQNAWNNEVFGGDQVANGIWAMSSGGVTGQGVGEGFAKTIPEAHTDMILPSLGEEFGWAGIICIFILFLIYLHRSFIIGRQTGTPFLFYVCAGIGVSTFVQFLLIAGGSTGALPLSGVALPFMSYGGSSLLCNMLAAGFLLSASHLQGSVAQMKFITRQQDKNLLPALVAACVGIVLLGVNVSKYLFNNKKWVVEPALVADRSGARMFSYNPRISILMNRLQAGNLLDRKGLILATSHQEQINKQYDSLIAVGIPKQNLEAFAYKRLNRYYPFGEQMFFWTGDANTGVFNGSTNGYFGEYEHAAELRGFPTPTSKFQVSATRYKEDRFLPGTSTEMTVNRRDYSAIAPLLLAGINSREVATFKQKNRDVQLTMDATLQTHLNKVLATDDSVKIKRVSVVIMEDNTGDVLASASYPLPPVNDWDMLTLTEAELNRLPGWNVNSDIGFTYATQPGSTAKLVTALAAFNKLGEAAATKTIRVLPQDLIRIKSAEPDEAGNISIERAIVKSNNSFFIRLANEEQLQEEMATLYLQTGMFLHGVGGYFYESELNNNNQQNLWRELWRKTEFKSARSYNPNNIKRTRGKGISGMAWGQGELIATPAAVARLASGIANNGVLVPNRYVLNVSGVKTAIKPGVRIANSPQFAMHMTDYMLKQSAGKAERLQLIAAGKTGTPERIWKSERINDGWYVFFAPKAKGPGHIVTCIRLEAAKGSSEAVRLAGTYIIPELIQRGYIKSFGNNNNQNAVANRAVALATDKVSVTDDDPENEASVPDSQMQLNKQSPIVKRPAGKKIKTGKPAVLSAKKPEEEPADTAQ
ncbi:FtsW/RodA/SpoVE family cell cycle protein [Segetibacter sp.]|jgi:cell division protein FtsW (lipid II flippase)|uniref:FtsW/RodA/SpoVE family cell cycle protein n=1 Tax=Segetibacter sp. TaxID=2231182 RepID=UPI00260A433B|nr:FtsW/RodA/SpoVE family cell cycle protein [Segetibacter sp.]MCW3081416.1 cell cycle protein [Segetibacter sp.]